MLLCALKSSIGVPPVGSFAQHRPFDEHRLVQQFTELVYQAFSH